MADLVSIEKQIEKLTKQAAEMRSRNFAKTVREILSKMQAFGITADDLKLSSTGSRRKRQDKKRTTKTGKASKKQTGKKKRRFVVAAKYRGPNGETWSGRGLTPRWLVALERDGRTKKEFAI